MGNRHGREKIDSLQCGRQLGKGENFVQGEYDGPHSHFRATEVVEKELCNIFTLHSPCITFHN